MISESGLLDEEPPSVCGTYGVLVLEEWLVPR